MAAPLWITLSGILLYLLTHVVVNGDVDNKDMKKSEEYIKYQNTLTESRITHEIPSTASIDDTSIGSDTNKDGKIDSTYPEDGHIVVNINKVSDSEDIEKAFPSEHNAEKKESIQDQEESDADRREDEQNKIIQDQKEVPNDRTENEEEIKEVDINADTTNQSYHYLSFGNILKNIVDPVLESSTEVLADMPPFDNNDSSLNFTKIVENGTLDKSLGEDDELTNKTDKKVRFQCNGKNFTDVNVTAHTVKIVNNTGLLNALNFDKNESVSDCVLVLFFAPWCPFCAKMAPNYNALARAFPQLEVLAVDAAQFSNLNARFGTVLVPNILLFHQSRALVRFNQTDKSFDNLASFLRNITGLEPNSSVNVTQEDYEGPLSSIPTEESDYLLWVAWIFVLIFTSIVFVQSAYGQQCITKVRILWQEHQHID